MPAKAGQIVIDISAGTSKFVVDLEAAKGKIREFGAAGVGEHKAVSAAMKTLEGNFTNNKRAADAFITTVLGGGPLLKAAFPVVGAVAFAGVIGEVGKKVYDFFKEIKEAPDRIGGAFRSLNEPLRLTNDQLQVANDRLANDIAKLEGKRQNTLKLALDEARAAADKLADSLDKDLTSLNKILKEENVGFLRRVFGEAGTSDIKEYIGGESGQGGLTGRVRDITTRGETNIANARTKEAAAAARVAMDAELQKAYKDAQDWADAEIAKAAEKQRFHDRPALPSNLTGYGSTSGGRTESDQTSRLAELRGLRSGLAMQSAFAGLEADNAKLTGTKQDLTTAAENAQLEKPYEDRMKSLGVQLDAAKAKLIAIGQPEWAQNLIKSFEEGRKVVEEVNKALEKHHIQLTDAQKGQITLKELQIAQADSEAQWKTHLESSTVSINDRIRAQELLTAAIGKGYAATRQANIETQLMATLGAHYTDSAWMNSHQADVTGLRSKFGQQYDAKHGEQVAVAVDKLGDQIELEKSLAVVQAQGAEAVRLVTLAYKLRQMTMDGATREQIKAEIDLFNATRENLGAEAVAKINEKITATEKLTDAIFAGAEAQRKAANENKYAEMKRGGASADEVAAQRKLDEAEHQHAVTEEAGKLVTVYSDQVARLDQIEAAIQKQKKEHGDTLEIEIALRDLENERLKIAVQQELKLKGAKDGLKAFFLEMQQDAKSAANIIYDSLNSALDKASDQFAKLFTGQKTSFGQMFKSLGEEMVKESVKSAMQKGLGELGKKVFHIDPAAAGKPDGTKAKPYHVVMDGKQASKSGSPGEDDSSQDDSTDSGKNPLASLGGLIKSGAGAFVGLLGKLFSGGGGGGGESVTSSISYMAEGGDVDPGHGYIVGDGGEPEFFRPKTAGTITPAHKMGSSSYNYHIDARGADLGAANRTARAIEAAHDAAVRNSARVQAERAKRTPKRAGR